MRVVQYLWFDFVALITSWLPDLRPVLRLRGYLARPAFKRCGANLQIARRVTINFTNRMEIGRDVFLAIGCWVNAAGGVVLEDGAQIGPYAVLASGDHTQIGGSYRFSPRNLAPIRISRGAWIAAHATITRGVVVGRGAVVAANSVATRDVPPFSVVGGVPARAIRKKARFEAVS